MKRLLPAPVLSVALAALWLVLNGFVDPGHWLFAAVLGVTVPLMTQSLRPIPTRFHRPRVALQLFLVVGRDVLEWNWRVLRSSLARRENLPAGGFVIVPLDLRDPSGLAVLAAIMCVIPGTIWSELATDRSALLVHFFDLKDPQMEIEHIKARYERPLMEIFE